MSYFNSLHCTLGFFGVVKRALGMLTFLKCGRAFSVSGSSAVPLSLSLLAGIYIAIIYCWRMTLLLLYVS